MSWLNDKDKCRGYKLMTCELHVSEMCLICATRGYSFTLNVFRWEVPVSGWPSPHRSLRSYTGSLWGPVWPLKTFEFATPMPVESFSMDRIIKMKTIIATCVFASSLTKLFSTH